MIGANSHGTLRVLRAFLPLLRPNGRMVVVASSLGVLGRLPEHLRARFVGEPDAVNAAMDAYVEAVEAGTAEAEGWPAWVNIPSKVGQVAVTRAFARWAQRRASSIHSSSEGISCQLPVASCQKSSCQFPVESLCRWTGVSIVAGVRMRR